MRTRQPAIFLVTILILAGASAFRVLALTTTPQPVGAGMRRVFLALSVGAIACAIAGSLRALWTNRLGNPVILGFLVLYSINVGSPGANLTWQALEMSFNVTVDGVGLGINLFGLTLLAWYSALNRPMHAVLVPADAEPRREIVRPDPLPS
jgi:hypothetical protein